MLYYSVSQDHLGTVTKSFILKRPKDRSQEEHQDCGHPNSDVGFELLLFKFERINLY